jgi:hypothetical protein
MAVYCAACGTQRNFPMSSVRAYRGPCDFCGGYDQFQVKKGERIETRNLPNYSYPTNLLPSVVETVDEERV